MLCSFVKIVMKNKMHKKHMLALVTLTDLLSAIIQEAMEKSYWVFVEKEPG